MNTSMWMKMGMAALVSMLLVGCVRHIQPYEKKVRHYQDGDYQDSAAGRTQGSLWNAATGSFFEDARARNVGDIITVVIQEQASASRTARTKTDRASDASYGVSSFFGSLSKIALANPDLNMAELFKTSAEASFDGGGNTNRNGTLDAVLPARIKRRMPNGDFYVEGSKIVLINDEESLLYLSGVVRSVDIAPDNSVSSLKVADAEVEYTGRGIITDRQAPGWAGRMIEAIWPF
tara:strand:- start:17 stop:718 length:702 start_codon:yes stop_codon:yes gene_type:complete